MFRRLGDQQPLIRFHFNDVAVEAVAGENVAIALLAAGYYTVGTNNASGAERGPFCMMGSCFECYVEVDGQSVQACQLDATDGLKVYSLRQADSFSGTQTREPQPPNQDQDQDQA